VPAVEVSIASLANISVLMYRSPGFLIVSPATEGAVLAARAAPVDGEHRLPGLLQCREWSKAKPECRKACEPDGGSIEGDEAWLQRSSDSES